MNFALEISNLAVDYGSGNKKRRVLEAIDLRLRTGEFACLLGVTGSGKTALLRAIAGFVKIAEGEIRIGDGLMSAPNLHLPPQRRHTGLVFQDYNLFPHLSVARNIGYGLRLLSRENKRLRITKLLELARLHHKADAYPHQLSGGERQRAALARAMATSPRLILLDEPFASQDANLREALGRELKQMLHAEKITALMVTHDQTEAFSLSDKLGVLQNGCIAQWDEPYRVYHKPINRAIAQFVGMGSGVKGHIINGKLIATALGQIRQDVDMQRFRKGQQVQVYVRPEDIVHNTKSKRKAEVIETSFRGANILYKLRNEQSWEVFYAITPSFLRYREGDRFGFSLAMEEVILFEENHQHEGGADYYYQHTEQGGITE